MAEQISAKDLIDRAEVATDQTQLDEIEMAAESRTTVLEAVKHRRDQLTNNPSADQQNPGGDTAPPAQDQPPGQADQANIAPPESSGGGGDMPTTAPSDPGYTGEAITPADVVADYQDSHRAAARAQQAGRRLAGQPNKAGQDSATAAALAQHQLTWRGQPTAPAPPNIMDDENGPIHQPTLLAGEPVSEHMAPPVTAITVAAPASSGYTGRTLTGGGLQLAAPAPTPSPSDPDLTGWRRERDQEDGTDEPVETMALDHERDGGESQEYSVGELVDYLESVNEPTKLDEIASFETNRQGGPRARAMRAIQDRREELATANV